MGPCFEGGFRGVIYWVSRDSELGAHSRRPEDHFGLFYQLLILLLIVLLEVRTALALDWQPPWPSSRRVLTQHHSVPARDRWQGLTGRQKLSCRKLLQARIRGHLQARQCNRTDPTLPFIEPNTTRSHTPPEGYPELLWALFWVGGVWLEVLFGSTNPPNDCSHVKRSFDVLEDQTQQFVTQRVQSEWGLY